MRTSILMMLLVAGMQSSGAALAQAGAASPARAEDSAPQEAPDEVIVRGRRLADFKIEMEQARIRAYDIFNEINSDDDFDVHCRDESRSGTRVPQQVCRARFEGRISSDAGQEYLAWARRRCNGPLGLTVDCLFSDQAAGAISAAQGVEATAPTKRQQLSREIERLARQHLRFAEAIVEWYESSLRYDEARRQSRERRRER